MSSRWIQNTSQTGVLHIYERGILLLLSYFSFFSNSLFEEGPRDTEKCSVNRTTHFYISKYKHLCKVFIIFTVYMLYIGESAWPVTLTMSTFVFLPGVIPVL